MSVPSEDNMSPHTQCHRIAWLGLDRNLEDEEEELRLSAQARVTVADPSNSGETNGKYVVDIFGQTHPSVANEVFDCMNCGRPVVAGRFAHLEKCMGKGRKARVKATRSSTAAQQNRYSRGSPVSTYSPIQILPAQTGYQMEHMLTQLKSTQMEIVKSHESNMSDDRPTSKHRVATTCNEASFVLVRRVLIGDFNAQSVCKYCEL